MFEMTFIKETVTLLKCTRNENVYLFLNFALLPDNCDTNYERTIIMERKIKLREGHNIHWQKRYEEQV